MYRKKKYKFLFYLIAAAGGVLLVGFLLKVLWNALVPAIFGLQVISFPQALGLLLLSRLLFGRWGGWGGPKNYYASRKQAWKEKWEGLSEEEKMQMKEAWKKRCEKKY